MHDARDRNQGIWIEPSDRLYVAAYSSVASLVVRFSGYFRRASGEVTEYAVDVNPTSDRAVTASDVFFGGGFLLSCVAHLASGNASRGQCYVRAQVQRNTGTAAVKLHTVVAGYVSDEYSPSFPYGTQEGPLEGPGMLRSFTGTDPAAGVDIVEVVPTGARWRLIDFTVSLAVANTGLTRSVSFYADNGTTIFLFGAPGIQHAINTTQDYQVMHHGDTSTNSFTAIMVNIPEKLILPAGYRFGLYIYALAAGDDFGAPKIYIEEWIEA